MKEELKSMNESSAAAAAALADKSARPASCFAPFAHCAFAFNSAGKNHLRRTASQSVAVIL